jgi:hypothetical protein
MWLLLVHSIHAALAPVVHLLCGCMCMLTSWLDDVAVVGVDVTVVLNHVVGGRWQARCS